MTYKFKYQTTAMDYFQLSMYYMYGSVAGVCNILFTVSMILLTNRYWSRAEGWVKAILLICCCLFPVIQPIAVYSRAKKRVRMAPKNLEMILDDSGVCIHNEHQRSELTWDKIKRISRKPKQIVLFSTTTHGYMLTNRVLGDKKEEVYQFILSKIKEK